MREPAAGDSIDQYQLTELLARSGMASIFKARDAASGDTVVLKIPHPQLESDVVFYQRFKREEDIGLRIDHPAIVKMLRPGNKTRMYLPMEFVDGVSLRATLQQRKTLPREQALDIAIQVSEALDYLHGQRVVHRDIKPENILLLPSGRIKILDFGIALDESARRLTWFKLSSTLGTPDYMAPEQIAGRRGDERTDIYAVGTLLYEMLTGNLPFEAPHPQALMRMKTTSDPRAPSYYLPAIDPLLETIIMRAIARAPRDRYASIADLLADLRDPQRAAAAPVAGADGESARVVGRGRGWMRRSRSRKMAAMAVASLVLLAFLVWLSARHSPDGGAPAPAAPAGQNP
ncbi:MAG TPA: serine/threonine-protein kinase [Polyangia bacterium]|nr:serine/threonine-protein kinase [Polyangia bacterium]